MDFKFPYFTFFYSLLDLDFEAKELTHSLKGPVLAYAPAPKMKDTNATSAVWMAMGREMMALSA